MKTAALFLIVVAACAPARAQAPLADDQQKTLYALGSVLGQRIAPLGLSTSELTFVSQGMADSAQGKKSAVELQVYGPKIDALAQERLSKRASAEKEDAKSFLAKAAKEKGAKKLESGVVYRETKAGSGASPKADSKVKVHYHGTLRDGTVFDSSVERKEPAEFPLNGVISCWTEAVQKMKVGGKARIVCPSETAYGDQGRPGIPPGATLSFDVELLEILK